MRQIEQQMLAAIRARKNWKNGSTQVSYVPAEREHPAHIEVFLHRNLIARIYERNIHHVGGIAVTLAGWNTPTTRSRLNAILREVRPGHHGIGTKLGQAYYFYRETLESRPDEYTLGDNEWHNISGEL